MKVHIIVMVDTKWEDAGPVKRVKLQFKKLDIVVTRAILIYVIYVLILLLYQWCQKKKWGNILLKFFDGVIRCTDGRFLKQKFEKKIS